MHACMCMWCNYALWCTLMYRSRSLIHVDWFFEHVDTFRFIFQLRWRVFLARRQRWFQTARISAYIACVHACMLCMLCMRVMHACYACMLCVHACYVCIQCAQHTHAYAYKAHGSRRLLQNIYPKTTQAPPPAGLGVASRPQLCGFGKIFWSSRGLPCTLCVWARVCCVHCIHT